MPASASGNQAYFWIGTGANPRGGVHVAFAARVRARRSTLSIRRRWPPAAATTARPALRPQYHPNYYGAFVFDPDGNNIEAVRHRSA